MADKYIISSNSYILKRKGYLLEVGFENCYYIILENEGVNILEITICGYTKSYHKQNRKISIGTRDKQKILNYFSILRKILYEETHKTNRQIIQETLAKLFPLLIKMSN
jgi:hypothetical protein